MYTNVGRVPSTLALGSQKQPGNVLARFAFATAHIVTRDMYSRTGHAQLNLRVHRDGINGKMEDVYNYQAICCEQTELAKSA